MFQGAIDDFKLQVPVVSGFASEVWKKCSPEVVELFTKLSQIAKSEHSEINPGYVYMPNRSKSRIAKNKTNSIQEKYSSLSPNAPVWTTESRPNYFDPQDNINRIPSQANFHPDENSCTIEDSITTAQNIQAISSHFAYLTTIDPFVHDMTSSPLETINDPYQQQFYQHPTNNLFYPNNNNNNDLSMDQLNAYNTSFNQDVNTLMQAHLTSIPNHPIHFFPTTTTMNDDYNSLIFNSPISESEDMALPSDPMNVSSFHMGPIQESWCIDYSSDHFSFF